MSQHNDANRGWLWPWILLAAFVGVWVTGIYLLVDRSQITQQEAVEALAASSFEGPLPADVELVSSGGQHGGYGRYVSFADIRETPHAQGGAVVISYRFRPSNYVAEREFDDVLAELPEALDRTFRPGGRKLLEQLDPAEIPTRSVCLRHDFGFETCEFVVRDVWVEVSSSLPSFVPGEDTHLDELSRAAYDHITQLFHL